MTDVFFEAASTVSTDLRGVQGDFGVFVSARVKQATLLVKCEDGVYAFHLNGSHAFKFFKIKSDMREAGIYFPNPRILIDHESIQRGSLTDDKLGFLFQQGADLFIGVSNMSFEHDINLCLINFKDGSFSDDSAHVSFSRWQIVIDEGHRRKVLWESGDLQI